MTSEATTNIGESQNMNLIIRMEEAAIAALGIYLLTRYNLGISVWLWIPLFLSPDISMLGYLVNTRIGAICYNLFHHKGIALVLAAIGFFVQVPALLTVGILLFAHSSFDRMMGYGLKYSDDFKHTHLGWLPQKKEGNLENIV
jgi:hypothetical protein